MEPGIIDIALARCIGAPAQKSHYDQGESISNVFSGSSSGGARRGSNAAPSGLLDVTAHHAALFEIALVVLFGLPEGR